MFKVTIDFIGENPLELEMERVPMIGEKLKLGYRRFPVLLVMTTIEPWNAHKNSMTEEKEFYFSYRVILGGEEK